MGIIGSEKEKRHLNHFHIHHKKMSEEAAGIGIDDIPIPIPKGCLSIMVGVGEEEQRRFVIPVIYVNHPLFAELLKQAEDEYGFHHKGPITIPCHIQHFRTVQGIIHNMHHHHHHFPVSCFRASSSSH